MTIAERSVARGAYQVRTWESGAGSPLVFLHGFAGWLEGGPFLDALATGHHVVAPEHPGFGRSTGIEQIDDIFDMSLYYRQFLEGLDGGPVDLVGHSLGGMFAAEIAALCPQLVRKVVLIAPFGLWLDEAPTPDLFEMSPNRLQRATWHDAESTVAQQFLTRSASANGASGIDAIVERAMNLGTVGKFLWPLPDRGLRKRLPLIKAPTLVIVGESDGLVPVAHGRAFVDAIPDARLEVVSSAGHYPIIEQQEQTVALISEFLAG